MIGSGGPDIEEPASATSACVIATLFTSCARERTLEIAAAVGGLGVAHKNQLWHGTRVHGAQPRRRWSYANAMRSK